MKCARRFFCFIVFLYLHVMLLQNSAFALDIIPFYTQNQSPVVQIFGLPPADNAIILPPKAIGGILAFDVANTYNNHDKFPELITLDGESYRLTFALRYGFTETLEGGLDIPLVGQGGGVFDSFIEGWHDFFGMPQNGRDKVPKNRLLYAYEKNGQEKLLVDDSSFGLGDIRLSAGYQLYNDKKPNPLALALRGSVKLPTGNSNRLHGSGSTDFALWLTGSDDFALPALGHITLFGAGGAMAMTDGDVIKGQQMNVAGFGTIGFGWAPTEWIALKTQFSCNSPFYKDSTFKELDAFEGLLVIGGTLGFTKNISLDIGVSEDVIVSTTPDVALHVALHTRF